MKKHGQAPKKENCPICDQENCVLLKKRKGKVYLGKDENNESGNDDKNEIYLEYIEEYRECEKCEHIFYDGENMDNNYKALHKELEKYRKNLQNKKSML